jgi:methionine-rich copper-binding protein CopC
MRAIRFIAKSFLVFLLLINGAYAHNALKESFPADKGVLSSGPEVLTLSFSDPTYLEKVEIQFEDGVLVDIGFEPSKQASSQFSVPLPMLSNGEYRVNWLVIGDDTHEIKGEFTFTVRISD